MSDSGHGLPSGRRVDDGRSTFDSRRSTPRVRRSAVRRLPDQQERRTPRNDRAKELELFARERGAHGMDGSRRWIGQDVPRTGAVRLIFDSWRGLAVRKLLILLVRGADISNM